MEKHKNIPEEVVWNEEHKQWELGEKNTVGKAIGVWNEWHADGHLCGTVDYGDGTPPFITKRFHPDGTLAQEGCWLGCNKWQGTYRWIKSVNPTPEYFPGGYPKDSTNVWMVEYDYTGNGTTYYARRYFDRHNNAVSERGTPLPERPATVHERAYFVDTHATLHILAHWAMSEINPWTNLYHGDYAEWDLNGNLLLKRIFDENGLPVEEFNAAIVPEQVGKNYYTHAETPVLSSQSSYSYNGNDHKQTYYNETGQLLYTVRQQHVTNLHMRRYYNDTLVYEGIRTIDNEKPPIRVKYFYAHGTILLDYTSNGDGSGTFRMYDETGQVLLTLPRDGEAFLNKEKRWGYFLPRWTTEPEHTTLTAYLNAIIQHFKAEYELYEIEMKIKALPVPAHLQTELDKIDWEKISAACNGGKELPANINGWLTGDSALVTECAKYIWWEIECQGELYEATYATTTVVAHMLPYYKHEPVITKRLFDFLYNVMRQPAIRNRGYIELVTSLEFLIPQAFQWAGDEDPITARQGQHILIHVAQHLPETEAFLQKEWQQTTHSRTRRGYALFCLGRLYEIQDEDEKIRSQFLAAFEKETDILLLLILAMLLIKANEYTAQESWANIINNTVSHPDEVSADMEFMRPFIGDGGLLECLYTLQDNMGYASDQK